MQFATITQTRLCNFSQNRGGIHVYKFTFLCHDRDCAIYLFINGRRSSLCETFYYVEILDEKDVYAFIATIFKASKLADYCVLRHNIMHLCRHKQTLSLCHVYLSNVWISHYHCIFVYGPHKFICMP